jgi:hypothetical protein
MIHPMNVHMPTDEEMHTAFAQGEAAVMAVFHAVATQVAALARQLAEQSAVLQECAPCHPRSELLPEVATVQGRRLQGERLT